MKKPICPGIFQQPVNAGSHIIIGVKTARPGEDDRPH